MFVRFEVPTALNSLVDEFLAADVAPFGYSAYPALEVAEYEHESTVVAELPGVRKEDIKIVVEDGVLTISGERKPYEIPKDAKILLNEVRVREFKRAVELPHEVDSDKISAELEHGLLKITLPKAEHAKALTIQVK